jgi:superfamily II DNA or RNA helicase
MTRRNRFEDLLRLYGNRPRVEPPPKWAEDERDRIDVDWDIDRKEAGTGIAAGPPPRRPYVPPPRPFHWKEHLESLRYSLESTGGERPLSWRPGREILYVVDIAGTLSQGGLILDVCYRDPRKRGGWTQVRRLSLERRQLRALPDPDDRRLLALLAGGRDPDRLWMENHPTYGGTGSHYLIPAELYQSLLPLLCATGRCHLRGVTEVEPLPLTWDDGLPWTFSLDVRTKPGAAHYLVTGCLRRGPERLDLSAPKLIVGGGLVFTDERVARLDDGGAFAWIAHLSEHGSVRVPVPQASRFIEALLELPRVPPLELPEELRYEEVSVVPRPRLRIRPGPPEWGPKRLRGELSFDYDGIVVLADHLGAGVFEAARRRFIVRDTAAERHAATHLGEVGFREASWSRSYAPKTSPAVATRDLPRAVSRLVKEGWHVEADGKLYRQAGAWSVEVTSGVDWFDLAGTVEFGDTTAQLPALLAALRRGESTVLLGDGTFGILPDEWLKKYGVLAGLGTPTGDQLRFGRTQVGLLDALLSALPEASYDEVFTRAREELLSFDGIKPGDAPAGFTGQLREYQREGLGWLRFLHQFGFGGCLADDMGLGKTVQVLALLESRRAQREAGAAAGDGGASMRPGPSLVVVPRSLVFNWKQEAARFTPKLRVLDHTGAGRLFAGERFEDYDLVVTTYGTLRHDAPRLQDARFDYVILDEAQAIKNARTESAKAARLLRGDHRLALSGTPVQNHLGELWSLFEFLNPGMLGAAATLGLDGPAARSPDADTRALLARALRPFILRRTKEQVARDLPPKTEQTLLCELDPAQRGLYDELRGHYRAALRTRIGREGIERSKIQILEALLRLRQAACHPGLIDRARVDEGSAKLDVLLPQLAEVREEGHKALVFSQFTSFLAIVRARLDREGVPYEYLDGKTRDRAARVARFQTDPECLLFLVSLKAGGLGLNLTAAEYVFLLDPWWNPAVEAQAIDRTHRIGQSRPVFAYRLIARDTVEEKVLELQETKRALADSIIAADDSLIRTLSRDDLELLLS